ncbi:hypothetical protein RM530_04030 [Algiphilus sp. W345]|uniref:Uncharacterized protein n=1 Tax=Banduia mediterranea TaxID=3075609 RepID=A0ABU2WF88_9GAMM|nr:hypothetical protein [Algiphilus sp. W345]MDT0496534.1 hypothetical protein [Algiphilus sp. W345]
MSETPGDAVPLALVGELSPPAGDALALAIDPPCYVPPAGNFVALALAGDYTPPSGAAVALALVCDGIEPPPPPGNVYDGLAARTRLPWDPGDLHNARLHARWVDAPRADAAPIMAWQWARMFEHPFALRWAASNRADNRADARWNWADPLGTARRSGWRDVPKRDSTAADAWDWGDPHDAARTLPYRNPPPRDAARRLEWDAGDPHGQLWRMPWRNPPPKDVHRVAPWDWAKPLRQRYGIIEPPPITPPPVLPCYLPPAGDAVRLSLTEPMDPPPGDRVALRIRCKQRVYVIHRRYVMQHSLSVVRLPDRLPLHVVSVSISTDRDSWAWSVDLQIADRASYHAIMPDGDGPKLVEVNASGHVWTALIERASERRSAPSGDRGSAARFSASGRSRSALLAEPYAIARPYINEEATTAAQAAARELDFSGFALDWQVDDWLIPAGAWHYDRETPLSAITKIAAACGGVVQSHPEDETLIVRPAYAVAPWAWDGETPSVIMDGQSLIEMGREWRPGPQYLGIYVSGESDGVLVNVIRDGSAGSPYAQMIVDPLITATEPARGRGTREIADSENQTLEPVVLPLLPAPAGPGVIQPCELVQVEDPIHGIYKAQATGVSISASLAGDGAVTIRQTVELARHYPVDLT